MIVKVPSLGSIPAPSHGQNRSNILGKLGTALHFIESKHTRGYCVLLAASLLAGCGFDLVSGRSMGTTYAIQADCPGAAPREHIAAVLAEVDGQMSTFDSGSELAAFNRAPRGQPVPISAAVVEVVDAAKAVAEQTGGAFDPTVAPLVALWGFGAADVPEAVPTEAQIQAALGSVGYRKLVSRLDPPSLEKHAPLTLDLSAIAKGYAVDQLAEVLQAAGCRAYLIELGGELRVAGTSPGGGPWRLGVESPAGEGHLAPAIVLRRGAVATSGDYRQYRERGGVRISHLIDPRTGRPVAHRLASVTVVAETTLFADAYATALMVLGEDAGLRFAEQNGLAALFVVRTNRLQGKLSPAAGDGFEIRRSTAMEVYLP